MRPSWEPLLSGLAFLYVFGTGRKMGGPVAGLAAVVLLFVHQRMFSQHELRPNEMDAAVLLAYCGAVYHFLAWRSPNPDMKRHILAMSLFFVLAFTTEFVAGLVLPIMLVLAAAATHQDRVRAYRDWRVFVMVALLAFALIAAWFFYQGAHFGERSLQNIVADHVMKRFTASPDPTDLQPWNYYFIRIWEVLRANSTWLLTIAGALLLVKRILRGRSTEALLVVLWFGVPLVAISSTASKASADIYPFLPPMALAGGVLVAWIAGAVYRILGRLRQG